MRWIVIFLQLLFFFKSFAYINVYPTKFDKRIEERGSIGEYFFTNKTSNPIKYRFSFIPPQYTENDMTSWISFYPNSITVNPGDEGSVKFLIKPPKNSEKGEYKSFIYIEEIPMGVKNGVTMLTNLKMEVLGWVGELEPKIEIRDSKIFNVGERRGNFEFFLENSLENKKYLLSKSILKDESIDLSELFSESEEKYKYFSIYEGEKLVYKEKLN